MITIDGSAGEGGGQVLRTSLTLSLVTGTAFRIENIRAKRKRPGLMRQHLLAIHAAQQIGSAEVTGAEIGSAEVTFSPKSIIPGEYRFSVGSAGSTTLVTQTVLPALLCAEPSSTLILEGGTHNPLAPPFDFLQRVFIPVLERMGVRIDAELQVHGFYPAGGGKATIRIHPSKLTAIDFIERGNLVRRNATAITSRLPEHVARRELDRMKSVLNWEPECFHAKQVQSPGPGNVCMIEVGFENVTELFSAFGERGLPAETVADRALVEAQEYLNSKAVMGTHLADQMLVPFAMSGGGSFTTLPLTSHTVTNIETIKKFLPVQISVKEIDKLLSKIEIA